MLYFAIIVYHVCHFDVYACWQRQQAPHCTVPLPTHPGAVPVQSFGAKQVPTDYMYCVLTSLMITLYNYTYYVIYVLRTD